MALFYSNEIDNKISENSIDITPITVMKPIQAERGFIYIPNEPAIKCSCERQYNYKNLKNIPYKNVKCECGDFIIFYDNYRDKTFINKLLKQWKTIL